MLLRKTHADALKSAAKLLFEELKKIPPNRRMAAIAQFGIEVYFLLERANSDIAFDDMISEMFQVRTSLS